MDCPIGCKKVCSIKLVTKRLAVCPANIYLFKVNNRTYFKPFSGIPIVDFGRVNVS